MATYVQNNVDVCKQAPVPFPKGTKSRGDSYGNSGLQRLGEPKREKVERERSGMASLLFPSPFQVPTFLPTIKPSQCDNGVPIIFVNEGIEVT